jgi:hypothetical protein
VISFDFVASALGKVMAGSGEPAQASRMGFWAVKRNGFGRESGNGESRPGTIAVA